MTQETADFGRSSFARSSFAVRPHVLERLPGLVAALELRSVAQMLTMLVERQEEVVPLLKPIADQFKATQPKSITVRQVRKELKKKISDASPETLRKILELTQQDQHNGHLGGAG